MARPMLLIKEPLLEALYIKHKVGVKYNTLIKNYGLYLTGPTLKKLIRFYSIAQNTDKSVSDTIKASLFPEWLTEETQYQKPADWVYIGTMPLGTWEKRQ